IDVCRIEAGKKIVSPGRIAKVKSADRANRAGLIEKCISRGDIKIARSVSGLGRCLRNDGAEEQEITETSEVHRCNGIGDGRNRESTEIRMPKSRDLDVLSVL